MTAHLWAKITDLPARLTEALLAALAVRAILRQIDRIPLATRALIKRRRTNAERARQYRLVAQLMVGRGITPDEMRDLARRGLLSLNLIAALDTIPQDTLTALHLAAHSAPATT